MLRVESREGWISAGSGGVSLVQRECAFEWKRHFAPARHAVLERFRKARHWAELLASPGDEGQLKRLKSATYSGKPLGSKDFVKKVLNELAAGNAPEIARKEPGTELGLTEGARAGIWAVGG